MCKEVDQAPEKDKKGKKEKPSPPGANPEIQEETKPKEEVEEAKIVQKEATVEVSAPTQPVEEPESESEPIIEQKEEEKPAKPVIQKPERKQIQIHVPEEESYYSYQSNTSYYSEEEDTSED